MAGQPYGECMHSPNCQRIVDASLVPAPKQRKTEDAGQKRRLKLSRQRGALHPLSNLSLGFTRTAEAPPDHRGKRKVKVSRAPKPSGLPGELSTQ